LAVMNTLISMKHRAMMLALSLSVVACGPGTTPLGQPVMMTLDENSLDLFKRQFNEATDIPRVILLLSPT